MVESVGKIIAESELESVVKSIAESVVEVWEIL